MSKNTANRDSKQQNESKAIKVLIKQPGQKVIEKEITDELETYQRIVDGYIETVTLSDTVVLIVNEEARLRDPEVNSYIIWGNGVVDILYGTIIACSFDGENFASITSKDKALLKGMLNDMELDVNALNGR